jgi:hypothetical protein
MKKVFIFSIMLLFAWFSFGFGQTQNPGTNTLLSKSNPNFSLFNADKLKMSHSYSFTYFSGKSGGGSFGIYTNTIQYQLAKSLRMKLDLNFLHSPFSFLNRNQTNIKSKILPNFQLWYKPNSSFSLFINFQTAPFYEIQSDRDFWQWER